MSKDGGKRLGTSARRLFDVYVCVDWSARNVPSPASPSADAIWTAEVGPRADLPRTHYHRTRANAAEHLWQRLTDALGQGQRVLVGCDFPFGYPRGFAGRLPLKRGPPWLDVWRFLACEVQDSAENRSNRFAVAERVNAEIGGTRGGSPGPFWGHPPGRRYRYLAPRSPGFPFHGGAGAPLARVRGVESRLKGTQEAWKLYGVGSVGSQALTGIPVVHALRFQEALAGASRVWPFETGFTSRPTQNARIVFAEAWPGLLRKRVDRILAGAPGAVRDEVQVAELTRWAAELDRSGALARLFDTPYGLSATELAVCEAEEGWVLGA